jgi:hypothetical protein
MVGLRRETLYLSVENVLCEMQLLVRICMLRILTYCPEATGLHQRRVNTSTSRFHSKYHSHQKSTGNKNSAAH